MWTKSLPRRLTWAKLLNGRSPSNRPKTVRRRGNESINESIEHIALVAGGSDRVMVDVESLTGSELK